MAYLIRSASRYSYTSGVGTKINARDFTLIPRHGRLQYCLPSVGAVNIARAQSAAFEIAELIEHEQRMIAAADLAV